MIDLDLMDIETLRAIQPPPQKRYPRLTDMQVITLKVQGHSGEGISCKVETGKRLNELGLQNNRAKTDNILG